MCGRVTGLKRNRHWRRSKSAQQYLRRRTPNSLGLATGRALIFDQFLLAATDRCRRLKTPSSVSTRSLKLNGWRSLACSEKAILEILSCFRSLAMAAMRRMAGEHRPTLFCPRKSLNPGPLVVDSNCWPRFGVMAALRVVSRTGFMAFICLCPAPAIYVEEACRRPTPTRKIAVFCHAATVLIARDKVISCRPPSSVPKGLVSESPVPQRHFHLSAKIHQNAGHTVPATYMRIMLVRGA